MKRKYVITDWLGFVQVLKRRSLFKVDYDIIFFSILMVLGRLLSGGHWLTDIIGSVILDLGLFCVYKAAVLLCFKE